MFNVVWSTPMGFQVALVESYYAAVSLAESIKHYHDCCGAIFSEDGVQHQGWVNSKGHKVIHLPADKLPSPPPEPTTELGRLLRTRINGA